jgi:hypothetical protein
MIRTEVIQQTETHFMSKSFLCCNPRGFGNKPKGGYAPGFLQYVYISELVAVGVPYLFLGLRMLTFVMQNVLLYFWLHLAKS